MILNDGNDDYHLARSRFPHALPRERLGQSHDTYQEFQRHVVLDTSSTTTTSTTPTKEYTLIIVTEYNTQRILLGKKHRGFGQDLYNSFGGKVEADEIGRPHDAAVRELHEETGIVVSPDQMASSRVGTLHFTFDDDNAMAMKVYLYWTQIQFDDDHHHNDNNADRPPIDSKDTTCPPPATTTTTTTIISVPSRRVIRPCDEITPIWWEDYTQIPLGHMFADDSIWLTYLLQQQSWNRNPSSSTTKRHLDGWFHFQSGGTATNTILHHCLRT